ncbi:Retrovirus-related Pol polyprotein from transposon opus [Sesamum angolense]|uniref:Retrovirus-related Pol polyprotein from transposon opus n=1 Tax=Sesamum angolense TaxID=2727404 RepID=A0AAE1T7V6_9LAMI|nr:Retrovirus-related Pol polyprotein from transposon opus [Sesamum angolense]
MIERGLVKKERKGGDPEVQKGFGGSEVIPLGTIDLPVSIGTEPQRKTMMVKFLVVDTPFAYNVILGRPDLNLFRAIVSTFHLKMKFSAAHGAMYQRFVNKMFNDLIGKTMKVYVDDMIVKCKEEVEHLNHLQAAFEVMRKYGMKLNPAKCTFGVRGGKFLGYMVSEKGIEANPEKIKVIMQMGSPKTIKDVQKLTEECEQVLRDLKQYLATPPLLANSKVGETLYLYLVVSEDAVSSSLVREEVGCQNPIYYVSKILQDTEKKYIQVEKLALALVTTARKLRPYFQSHKIVVLTNHPLK